MPMTQTQLDQWNRSSYDVMWDLVQKRLVVDPLFKRIGRKDKRHHPQAL